MGETQRERMSFPSSQCIPLFPEPLFLPWEVGEEGIFPTEVEGYKASGGINGQDTSELQTPKIMWDLMPSNYCRWTQLEESEAYPHPYFCNSNAPSALQ